uniref:Uncharacterized protein n=1 Tax=Knipowitschia caucasica TaxID=637954 RepID=A0AAV2LLV0_KNICA
MQAATTAVPTHLHGHSHSHSRDGVRSRPGAESRGDPVLMLLMTEEEEEEAAEEWWWWWWWMWADDVRPGGWRSKGTSGFYADVRRGGTPSSLTAAARWG